MRAQAQQSSLVYEPFFIQRVQKTIHPLQGTDLKVFALNKTRDEEDPDGKEADEEEREDHFDVGPGPETQHTQ